MRHKESHVKTEAAPRVLLSLLPRKSSTNKELQIHAAMRNEDEEYAVVKNT